MNRLSLKISSKLFSQSKCSFSRHQISKIWFSSQSNEKDIPKDEWIAVPGPKDTNLIYYWNPKTNETTPLGSPKPRNWVEVKGPEGSGKSYWWDPETNDTTPLGAPKPSLYEPLGSKSFAHTVSSAPWSHWHSHGHNHPGYHSGHCGYHNHPFKFTFKKFIWGWIKLGITISVGFALYKVFIKNEPCPWRSVRHQAEDTFNLKPSLSFENDDSSKKE